MISPRLIENRIEKKCGDIFEIMCNNITTVVYNNRNCIFHERDTTVVETKTAIVGGYDRDCRKESRSYPCFRAFY